jgi:hypothetical protein
MDVSRLLKELYQERELIDASIRAFQQLAMTRAGTRRGRPPAWMKNTIVKSAADPSEARISRKRFPSQQIRVLLRALDRCHELTPAA